MPFLARHKRLNVAKAVCRDAAIPSDKLIQAIKGWFPHLEIVLLSGKKIKFGFSFLRITDRKSLIEMMHSLLEKSEKNIAGNL